MSEFKFEMKDTFGDRCTVAVEFNRVYVRVEENSRMACASLDAKMIKKLRKALKRAAADLREE